MIAISAHPHPRSLGRGARVSEVGTDPLLTPFLGALGYAPMSCPAQVGADTLLTCVPHPLVFPRSRRPLLEGPLPFPDHSQHSPPLGTPWPFPGLTLICLLLPYGPGACRHHNHACLPTNLGVSGGQGAGPCSWVSWCLA